MSHGIMWYYRWRNGSPEMVTVSRVIPKWGSNRQNSNSGLPSLKLRLISFLPLSKRITPTFVFPLGCHRDVRLLPRGHVNTGVPTSVQRRLSGSTATCELPTRQECGSQPSQPLKEPAWSHLFTLYHLTWTDSTLSPNSLNNDGIQTHCWEKEKGPLFLTATHLLDFQREFDVGGCVLINRNVIIIMARPNFRRK